MFWKKLNDVCPTKLYMLNKFALATPSRSNLMEIPGTKAHWGSQTFAFWGSASAAKLPLRNPLPPEANIPLITQNKHNKTHTKHTHRMEGSTFESWRR